MGFFHLLLASCASAPGGNLATRCMRNENELLLMIIRVSGLKTWNFRTGRRNSQRSELKTNN